MIGKTVDLMLNDWSKIVLLYSLVHDFAELYNADKHNLKNIINIKSYNYTNLLMLYGQNMEVSVNISWCNETKQFLMTFIGGNLSINPHSLLKDQLQAHLNANHSLSQIAHILNETHQPLGSIAKLPILPQLGTPVRLIETFLFSSSKLNSFSESKDSRSLVLHHPAITFITSHLLSRLLLLGSSFERRWIDFHS